MSWHLKAGAQWRALTTENRPAAPKLAMGALLSNGTERAHPGVARFTAAPSGFVDLVQVSPAGLDEAPRDLCQASVCRVIGKEGRQR
jgi:hypothetical protein